MQHREKEDRMVDGKCLVSIGMPVYNEERYIEQALQSLLSQSVEDFELIISDNASTDRTGESCLAYLATWGSERRPHRELPGALAGTTVTPATEGHSQKKIQSPDDLASGPSRARLASRLKQLKSSEKLGRLCCPNRCDRFSPFRLAGCSGYS
jgi:glycosyltransferase involved in cell wall biosynthesis